MGFYCKNCGNWHENGHGPFCSFDCEHDYHNKERRAEFQRETDRINSSVRVR